ncbi:MAG: TIGR03086 family metal-binding protein [Acidimicrobiia bacterium]
MDVIATHAETLRTTQRVVDGVRPEHLQKPTPCTEWDVEELLAHMVGVNEVFAAAVRGEDPNQLGGGDILGDDPAVAYRSSVEEAVKAWATPNVLEQTLHLPFGHMPAAFAIGLHFIDNLVHRWDLAAATGQDHLLNAESAGLALQMCQQNFAALPAEQVRGEGKPFGALVDWPADAPVYERLVAFLGRHPHGGA